MNPPAKFSVLVLDRGPGVGCVLAESGFAVTVVETGQEAIRLIRQQPFDLVLLDIGIPGWNGLEACREIRKFAPCTKIIMMAGPDADEERMRAIEAGADDCVNHPLQFRELIARARAVLRLSRPNTALPAPTRPTAASRVQQRKL